MSPYQKLLSTVNKIEERIGYAFEDKVLLATAFVHRSFYNEHRGEGLQQNERLEFLGDSILNLLISDYLYQSFPHMSEGDLSNVRASLVEASMCARLVQKQHLAEFVLLGKGELMQEGRNKESIQADLFEALLGALYLDAGLARVKEFFWDHFSEEVEVFLKEPVRNWKAELQDYSQKNLQTLPMYRVLEEEGPDHLKKFKVGVFLEDMLLGCGMGFSKKEAEQKAAKEAFTELEKGMHGR
jgi:ribonuclease-3